MGKTKKKLATPRDGETNTIHFKTQEEFEDYRRQLTEQGFIKFEPNTQTMSTTHKLKTSWFPWR